MDEEGRLYVRIGRNYVAVAGTFADQLAASQAQVARLKAEVERLRRNHLRRMAESCWNVFDRWDGYQRDGFRRNRVARRILRFSHACLREANRQTKERRIAPSTDKKEADHA